MRLTAAMVAAGLLSGCFIAPGMKMDESSAADRGRDTTGNPDFQVHPLTPALLRKLADDRAKSYVPAVDPLAAEASRYVYRVAPFDVLQITVWDHPELTTPTGTFRSPEENGLPVHADGTMFYPHVGVTPVAGKTLAEVRSLLTDRLSRFVTRPQLDVRVASFRGRKMQVTGEVLEPRTVPVTDVPLRVQDAIALARGFGPDADYSRVTLSREGRVYRLDLQALYERGDVSQNWLLKDGDILNVGDRTRNRVFVLGEVRLPSSKQIVKNKMTLADAIGEADGLDLSSGNPAKIYVLRGDYEAPQIYRLDASSPDALLLAAAFPMQPHDVVYVSTYEIARWNRVISQLAPTVNMFWQVFDAGVRTNIIRPIR